MTLQYFKIKNKHFRSKTKHYSKSVTVECFDSIRIILNSERISTETVTKYLSMNKNQTL